MSAAAGTVPARPGPPVLGEDCCTTLVREHGGEARACDLTDPLSLTQPTISHHLKILVGAGIFSRDKRGKWAYYAVVPSALDALPAVLSTVG